MGPLYERTLDEEIHNEGHLAIIPRQGLPDDLLGRRVAMASIPSPSPDSRRFFFRSGALSGTILSMGQTTTTAMLKPSMSRRQGILVGGVVEDRDEENDQGADQVDLVEIGLPQTVQHQGVPNGPEDPDREEDRELESHHGDQATMPRWALAPVPAPDL